MEISCYKEKKYETIINIICQYKGISKDELKNLLKDKECKYLLLLLLEKYRCRDLNKVKEDLDNISEKSIKYNMKKAEERFFINREFREKYLELEGITKKII